MVSIGSCKYSYALAINSPVRETLPTIKILGIELDYMLSFKEYITKQLQKVYAKSGTLKRIRHFVPSNTMLWLYKSFILPHFEYCSPLLLGVGRVQVNLLEDANYYIFRSLLGYCKSILYEELLQTLNMEARSCRPEKETTIPYSVNYKCLKNSGPKYIKDSFSFRETMYKSESSRH